MTWTQEYNPTGNIYISALLAGIPILALFYALAFRRMAGHKSGLLALGLAILVAFLPWGMPLGLVLLSGLYGVLFGLFPIGWIIVTAIFLYNITVETGQFELIKGSIARVSGDRRLQALLIAFSFGAFLEGAAGFGAPVAISAAMLMGLGFDPFRAAGISLLANTAPVAFGGVGIPVVTLSGVTGIDLRNLSSMVGRQLPFLSVMVPAWLVVLISGWRGLREVLPAALVSGISFAATQWYSSNFIGPYLPDILSALVSIVALVILLRFWRPARIWRFPGEESHGLESYGSTDKPTDGLISSGRVLKAWAPFLLLTIIVVLWSVSSIKRVFDTVTLKFPIPGLHEAVLRIPPIVARQTPYAAIFNFNWLSAAGTALLVAAALSMWLLGMKPARGFRLFGRTVAGLWSPLLTIASVLALAFIMNYSGMSATLGLVLTRTGKAFPFFAPFIGWLGVFLTGSDTSSNALFGKLQTVTAGQIGADPTLIAAANTSGGVTGKMISPQSIAVATASARMVGQEGRLFRFTLRHSIAFVIVVSLITVLQASVLGWMVPR